MVPSDVDIVVRHRGTVTCAANIFANLGWYFYCIYGCSFQKGGDLRTFVRLPTCR